MEKELSFRGHKFKIWYLESYATHPTWYTFEDEQDVREAWWDVQPSDRVLDVGACCGSYTLTALACGAAYVHAWAPGKLQEGLGEQEILLHSLRLNDWAERCFVDDTGLFDRGGYLNTDTLAFSSSPGPEPQIGVERLDDIEASIGGVTLMKIDVEGAELAVLHGSWNILRINRPKVLVEHHLFRRRTLLEEVGQFFSELGGYELAGTIPHPASDVVHGLYVPVQR